MFIPLLNIDISLPKRGSARAELDKAARELQLAEAERIRRGEKGRQPPEPPMTRGKRLARETQTRWAENRTRSGSRESIW